MRMKISSSLALKKPTVVLFVGLSGSTVSLLIPLEDILDVLIVHFDLDGICFIRSKHILDGLLLKFLWKVDHHII